MLRTSWTSRNYRLGAPQQLFPRRRQPASEEIFACFLHAYDHGKDRTHPVESWQGIPKLRKSTIEKVTAVDNTIQFATNGLNLDCQKQEVMPNKLCLAKSGPQSYKIDIYIVTAGNML